MTTTTQRGAEMLLIVGEGWVNNTINEEGVSADAKYIAQCASQDAFFTSSRIVKHLWIIFVLLPVVLGILFAILYAVVKP
jgi:hypothetical protein